MSYTYFINFYFRKKTIVLRLYINFICFVSELRTDDRRVRCPLDLPSDRNPFPNPLESTRFTQHMPEWGPVRRPTSHPGDSRRLQSSDSNGFHHNGKPGIPLYQSFGNKI